MSFIKLDSKLIQFVTQNRIGAQAFLLYSVLLSYADPNGRCFPSRETLAKKVNLSARQISRIIKELIEAKLIKVYRDGFNRQSYQLTLLSPTLDKNVPQPLTKMSSPPRQKCQHNYINNNYNHELVKKSENCSQNSSDVSEIFIYWKQIHNKDLADFTPKRKQSIVTRLKDCSKQQIKDAILGLTASDWHMGKNPLTKGKLYNDITTICKTRDQVVKWCEVGENIRGRGETLSVERKQEDHLEETYKQFIRNKQPSNAWIGVD